MRAICQQLLALAATALSAAAVSAQTRTASFEGQIVDSISGHPIEGVLVRMDVGAEAFTDDRGVFRIPELPVGRRLFALLSADCRITWGQVDLEEGVTSRTRLELPPTFGAVADAEEREQEERRRGGGKRLEYAEIEQMHVRSVTELIRRIAPNMVGGMTNTAGGASSIRSGRQRSFITGQPVVVIDGVRVPDAAGTLDALPAEEVEVLEILPGAAAGWEYGSSGADGVIRITLRRGAASGAPERQEAAACVVPEFPRG